MSKGKRDFNDVRVKPGHHGQTGLPFGDYVWLLRRNDDKLYGVWGSRHDAIGAAATLPNAKEEWFDPIRVRTGTVRMTDVVVISNV